MWNLETLESYCGRRYVSFQLPQMLAGFFFSIEQPKNLPPSIGMSVSLHKSPSISRFTTNSLFYFIFFCPSPTATLSDPQLMQQQQALVAQSAYLSPVATVAAVQMQQLAALNPSGIIATPIASITPSSGKRSGPVPAFAPARVGFLLET